MRIVPSYICSGHQPIIVLLVSALACISASNDAYCEANSGSHSSSGSSSSDDSGFEELDDRNMQTAVNQWSTNRTGATLQYGPIETWDTSRVTHMWNLFKDQGNFNDDISNWNVACVTTMHGMFWG